MLTALALLLALGALPVPAFTGHVVDQAGLLEPSDRSRLEAKLTAFERDSGAQFALLVVPSLESEVLEDYAVHVFDTWGIGRKGKDDGLLMLIVAGERQVRIEVGDGLEGNITDALSSRVIRNVIAPAFREKDYVGGVDRALDALMTAAVGKAPVLPEDSGVTQRPGGRRRTIPSTLIFLGIFLLFAMLNGRSRRRGLLAGGAGFLGGGGGGFFGGGGGGGFGGGGGGRSSGGGASGGW
ncbi:MAG: TPM domain-containing protein [Clostridia bacterium]|nr:TPM domain-containing protein [Deltaproteobacteria bacterium]